MRLLTRSDFDGLVCAVLLVEKGVVDNFKFVHPKDVQDGAVKVTADDVLANVPYVPGCGLWFDHHASEEERLEMEQLRFDGSCTPAPSTAQVVWGYYGGEENFGDRLLPLLEAVNKTDSADLTREEVLHPGGWILLGFVMDPRTGLGRFKDYRISNYQLMEDLIRYCRDKSAAEILAIPDVQERTERYLKQQALYEEMVKRRAEIHGAAVVVNLMREETIYAGNRFLVFALYPEQNIELRIMWGKDKQNVVFACGHSIFNRTSQTNVGRLMLQYGGGGHEKVGTCQVDVEQWEQARDEIVARLRADG